MPRRVLITGFNAEQNTPNYYQRKQLKIVGSHYSLTECLRDMGYEVDHRPVEQTESLDSYDHVFIFLHSPKAFCQRLYSGIAALHARPDAIVAIDDWQVNQIIGSLEIFRDDLRDRPDAAFKDYYFDLYQGTEPREQLITRRDEYLDAMNMLLERQQRMLISAFAGGDLSKLQLDWPLERVFAYNPNPYHLNRTPENNYGESSSSLADFFEEDEKDRAWVFASLVQNKTRSWLKKQKVTWPVKIFGAKRGEHKSIRLTEPEMCREYGKNWGCLMPGYYHAGSGWWRARPLQVADVGSILICDEAEARVYGEAYVGVTAESVEAMTDAELYMLAKNQRECLYDKHPLDRAVQRAEIQRVLDAN